MVQPGTEDVISPQIPAMLMRDKVVGVVLADTEETERPQVFARQLKAG